MVAAGISLQGIMTLQNAIGSISRARRKIRLPISCRPMHAPHFIEDIGRAIAPVLFFPIETVF